ncbi:MAG: type II secretion system protein M [Gammaproteobacteria bacterium]|nr:type II secretion system protein M [Gammaproteobacteria bacterium]
MVNTYKQLLEQWWQSRLQREQWVLIVLAIFVVSVFSYKTIWLGIKEENQLASMQLQNQIQQWQWLKGQIHQIQTLQPSNSDNNKNQANSSASQLINRQAKRNNISISRFQQLNQKKINITIDETKYNLLIQWLLSLSEQHISIIKIQIKRLAKNSNNSGLVSARLTLEKK